jgi:hypothetical protein
VLTNEKYVGVLVSTKEVPRVGGGTVRRPPDQWLRVPAAYPPIVSPADFAKAQTILEARYGPLSDEALFEDLRAIYARHGEVNSSLIDLEARRSCNLYRVRFGSLLVAYELAGIQPTQQQVAISAMMLRAAQARRGPAAQYTEDELIQSAREILARHGRLSRTLIDEEALLRADLYRQRFGSLQKVYELAGYQPTPDQIRRMNRSDPNNSNPRAGWGSLGAEEDGADD